MARQMCLSLTMVLLAAAGCQGTIGDAGGGPAGSNGTPGNPATPGATGGPGAPGGSAGPGGSNPGGPAGPGGTPSAAGDPNAAGPMPLRRLTHKEFNNTLRDLLGDTTNPADAFPLDRDSEFLFKRSGLVTSQDLDTLVDAAAATSARVEAKIASLAPCTGAEDACARKFATDFGLRAYRRPLAQDEVDRLVALYTTGRTTLALDYAGGIHLMVEGMLQSPSFLYHWELGNNAPTVEGKVIKLSPYEVASRLSYFVWNSMPDAALFDAAATNKLGTQAEVEAQARRMIGDAKAHDAVSTFAEEWLNLDQIADRPKDPMIYPEFKDDLKAAMSAELKSFIDGVVFGGDGKLTSLLTGTTTYVNAPLAQVYGMTGVQGTAMKQAMLDPGQRSGLLTRAGFLTVTGSPNGSNPVKRGRKVYERFLCGELPPPPNNVPPAKPPSAGGTTRQRFVEHDSNACATACHQLMDPVGFGFEHYDGIGKYRTTDNGGMVDSSGVLDIDGAKRPFADARELSQMLAGSPSVARCFSTQWMRYAFKRTDTTDDRGSIDSTVAAFGKANSVLDLMVGLASSKSFRYRVQATGEKL
jgi:hypothetical protein